jgi:hypothetical protein
MKDLTVTQRVEMSEQLAARVMDDAGFKDELLRDPRQALASAFGLDLPDDIAVEVMADGRDVKHLILPFDAGTPEGGDIPQHDGQPEGVADWYGEVLARVRHDDLFRRRLLKNPKAALSEIMPIDLPDSYDVRVVEETADRRCLLLPYLEECYDRELHDGTLELVVGGKSSGSQPPGPSLQTRVKIMSGQRPGRWRPRHVCG